MIALFNICCRILVLNPSSNDLIVRKYCDFFIKGNGLKRSGKKSVMLPVALKLKYKMNGNDYSL